MNKKDRCQINHMCVCAEKRYDRPSSNPAAVFEKNAPWFTEKNIWKSGKKFWRHIVNNTVIATPQIINVTHVSPVCLSVCLSAYVVCTYMRGCVYVHVSGDGEQSTVQPVGQVDGPLSQPSLYHVWREETALPQNNKRNTILPTGIFVRSFVR